MKRKPNILVFFTDQQRADSCGCYGSPNGLTPFLDSLGEDGVVFENAFTCQPVCGPARRDCGCLDRRERGFRRGRGAFLTEAGGRRVLHGESKIGRSKSE